MSHCSTDYGYEWKVTMYIDKIETRDLFLKKASMDDVYDMHVNIWSKDETAKHMLWQPTRNIEEAKIRMLKTIEYQKNNLAYLIYEKKTEKAIGFAGMNEIGYKVYKDCGIAIGPEYVGCGYGKQILKSLMDYCFKDLDANKIVCSCRRENKISKKLLLSCGLHYSHTLPKTDIRDGTDYLLDIYDISRVE